MTPPLPPDADRAASAGDSDPPRGSTRRMASYWRANLRLIGGLLVVWAVVSFGFGLWWAPWLNTWRIGRLPLGFWWAQQGSILVFVVLVFIYAWRLDRIDRQFGVRE